MSKKNNILAVIPARGNSKRLPNKNILPLNGKAMIEWTILAAIKSRIFSKIIISSESKKILDICKRYDVQTHARDPLLSTDNSTVAEVCKKIIQEEKTNGYDYKYFCCLYATSPLRNYLDIQKTVKLVTSGKADFSIAVTKFDFPAFQALQTSEDNNLVPLMPDFVTKKTTDIGEIFVDNGSTYACRVDNFLKTGTFYGSPLKGFFMERARSIDIDYKEDYKEIVKISKNINLEEIS